MIAKTMSVVGAVLLVLAMSTEASAQAQFRLTGEIHDFTAPMDPPDPAGPWQIDGEWTLTLHTATGRIDVVAALNMIRSDNVTRAAHTHHLSMTGATATPIANGYRISGTAAFTSNGAPAPFSGSPVDIDVTGGSAVTYATVKMTFRGAAAGHFGPQALSGVVNLPQ